MAATLAQCQQLVAQLAGVVGQSVLSQSAILKVIYREYQQQVLAGGATTTLDLTDKDGAAITPTVNDLTDVTATLPVVRLLNNPAFFATTVSRLGRKLADVIDTSLLGQYSNFTTISPQGSPGTPVTDALIMAAYASLFPAVASEPRYFALEAVYQGGALAALTAPGSTAVGGAVALATLANGLPTKYRGFNLIPSALVPQTGSAPSTRHNIAFTTTALAFVTCQRALTNDATHVQANCGSTDGSLGVNVYLAYNSANDAQVIGFGVRGQALVGRNNHGMQVST